MNLGEIKAFLNPADRASSQGQLQGNGKGVNSPTNGPANLLSASSTLSMHSSVFIGAKVLNASFNQTVQIEQSQLRLPAVQEESEKPKQKGLFDFEEIAKNVLNFVGGVVKNAKVSGADEDKLNSLFEQAEQGVLKGIEMARKDLAGFMNEEIDQGINKSYQLIDQGLNDLRNSVFGREPQEGTSAVSMLDARSRDGELSIRTKEGDLVNINFSDASQVMFQSQANEQGERQTSMAFGSTQRFSFSVEGDLNEDELASINELVKNTANLAEDFFDGDIDKAFEQALSLGFDEETLTGFALQLSQTQTTQVARTYESVANMDEQNSGDNAANRIRPIADYLDKMLEVAEQAKNELEDGSAFDGLVNGIINQMEDVQVPDLIAALNRFNGFNQKLVDNLPGQQTQEPSASNPE